MHTLEFDSLFLEFDLRKVLSSVYMKCQTGNVVGLLGRNGSGKSCLMKIVFGAMSAEHKSVRIDGQYYSGNSLKETRITYLPQENFIPTFLTLKQALNLYKISAQELIQYFPEFENFMDLKSEELSGGYRRLAEVLMILKTPSWFSILDEPFSGLMPVHIEKLREIIHTEKHKKGIIITDHLHRHITGMADQLFVLSNGQTYKITDPDQLITLGYLVDESESD
ncbi:MAG TPA: ATP-binding cassette domain-containing protein [Cyclobacteriaceae bacterium]|jgi:ABC-type multidrug transport system ATPase subunit|nr:ATP-binding cassette domain-containing protein [Cyclobacteriaceae bacterium]